MALRAVRGTWDRFRRTHNVARLEDFPVRLLSRGGKLHAPPIDLVHPDVLRPAGWWAEHCPQPCPFRADFWLGCSHAENPTPAGEPLLSMPADDDIDPLYRTCSASPKRGGDGPVWGS